MRKTIQYSLVLLSVLSFFGCKEINLLPSLEKNQNHLTTQTCSIEGRYHDLLEKQDKTLNRYLNLASFAYQEKDYAKSNFYFDKSIKQYRFFENKGVVSASRTLSYITASFLNDTFLDYEGDGYEKVMIHNYKAINYLMLGEKENARIEIKNSYKKQMQEKDKFSEEIKSYQNEVTKQLELEKNLPIKKRRYRRSKESIFNKLKPLFSGINSEHVPYQNPFAYYISALVYEENNEFDDAYIDIKKASNFYPDSKILQEKLLYYARKAYGKNSQEYKDLHAKNISDKFLDKRAEIFINISNSPVKEQMKVPIYMGGAMQFTSFPTFALTNRDIDSVLIKDNNGITVAQSSVLTDVDAIVVNLFKERVPGIILRQIINVGSKTIASESISNKLDTGNVLVSAAIGLGMSLVNAVTSKADLRAWNTLPSKIDALSFSIEKNKTYTLYLLNKDGRQVGKQALVLNKNNKLKHSYNIITIKNRSICK